MNKIYTYIILASLIISGCDDTEKYNYERNKTKIFTYCDSFVKANPNPKKNDLVERKTRKLFRSQVPSFFNRDLFDDFLMRVESISENKNRTYSVFLKRAKTDRDRRVTSVLIEAITDKKTAFEIDQNYLYTLRAEFVKFERQYFKYEGEIAYFSEDVYVDDGNLSLGKIIVRKPIFIKSDKKFIL